MFQPVPLAQLVEKSPWPDHSVHVWWWPEHLEPQAATRRLRVDAILRILLSRYLSVTPGQLRFRRHAKGRPYLDHPGAPDFNLSDTRGGTVLAVAGTGRVGVDIERTARRLPVVRLANRWFAASEAHALAAMDPQSARDAFLRLWTAKEAACKATGTGIFGFLSQWRFVVDPGPGPPRLLELPADAGGLCDWTFHRLAPVATHTVAVASNRNLAVPAGFAVAE